MEQKVVSHFSVQVSVSLSAGVVVSVTTEHVQFNCLIK